MGKEIDSFCFVEYIYELFREGGKLNFFCKNNEGDWIVRRFWRGMVGLSMVGFWCFEKGSKEKDF